MQDKRKKKNTKNSNRLLSVLMVLLLLSACFLVFALRRYRSVGEAENGLTVLRREEDRPDLPEGIIAEEIRYENFPLGGLSYGEAARVLEEQEESLLGDFPPLQMTAGEKTIERTPYELGLRLDIDSIVNQAETQSKRWTSRKPIIRESLRIDEGAFAEAMNELAEEIDQKGQDAKAVSFDREKERFVFEKEQEGRKLDRDWAAKAVRERLETKSFESPLALEVEVSAPGRTAEELSKLLGHVSSASSLCVWSEERNTNVQLAADRIDGSIVLPGESFSYNECIGPMTLENGFVEAGIQDEDGNDDMGIGGGLCQPSTTLYQAAVRANMEILVHNFHSQPVGYCPIGTDAMVSNWSDVVFKNTSDYPYAITSYFDGSELRFDFYGPQNPDDAVIDLLVEVLDEEEVEGDPRYIQDDELEKGEKEERVKPRPSIHVKVYKSYTVDGQMVKKEEMYDHVYPGCTGVIAVNNPKLVKALKEGMTLENYHLLFGDEDHEDIPVTHYDYDAEGNLVQVDPQPAEDDDGPLFTLP